jgi:lysophospholipase L1-like esterase
LVVPVFRVVVIVLLVGASLVSPRAVAHASGSAAPACISSVGPGIPPPATVPSGLPGFHAAWYGQSGYQRLCPGQTATAIVAYYNSGSRGWVAGRLGEAAYLGTSNPSPGQDQPSALGGDGTNGSPQTGWPRYNRVAVQPASYVGPGQVAWFQFTIRAPATPGAYALAIRPVVEGAEWLEDYGVFWNVTVITPAPPQPMPIISTRLPPSAVYANDQTLGAAANARDGSWATAWRTAATPATPTAPNYLAYDLTSLPAASRKSVYSLWLDENYDYDTAGGYSYGGLIGDYKIQGNPAPGGALPGDGWVDLVAVAGNTRSAGARLLDLGPYNWVRLYITADSPNAEPTFHKGSGLQEWQLFDASLGTEDAWLFLGDSITSNAMTHQDADGFDALVRAGVPDRLPAWFKGSHGGWSTGSYLQSAVPGPTILDNYLAAFPGRYVAISLGTNDLASDVGGSRTATFYENMRAMVEKILAAGKLPVIPRIIYSPNPSFGPPNTNFYKVKIDELWAAYGTRIVQGPDLYTPFFKDAAVNGGPNIYWTGSDGLHPNSAGNQKLRRLWTDAMLATVYGAPTQSPERIISRQRCPRPAPGPRRRRAPVARPGPCRGAPRRRTARAAGRPGQGTHPR